MPYILVAFENRCFPSSTISCPIGVSEYRLIIISQTTSTPQGSNLNVTFVLVAIKWTNQCVKWNVHGVWAKYVFTLLSYFAILLCRDISRTTSLERNITMPAEYWIELQRILVRQLNHIFIFTDGSKLDTLLNSNFIVSDRQFMYRMQTTCMVHLVRKRVQILSNSIILSFRE